MANLVLGNSLIATTLLLAMIRHGEAARVSALFFLVPPLAALIAAGMVLHLQFATLWNDKWIYEYSVEWLPLLCLAAFRAGRWHGLDARFAATRARWFG